MRKNIIGGILLTLLIGIVSAHISVGEDIEGGADLEFYNSEVEPQNPLNSTYAESPMNFSCTINCDGVFQSWTVNVTNISEDTVYSYTETVSGAESACNQNKYWKRELAAGEYNWTCAANKTFMGVPFQNAPTYRNNFTIFIRSIDHRDTLGACLSEKGWSLEFNADSSHDYVVFNMTGLGNWCVDNNCSNVWVEDGAEYKYSTAAHSLIVDTRTQKNFVLWIAGHNYDYNHTVDSSTPDTVVNLTMADFTRENPSYWFQIRDEEDNLFFNYSLDSAELKLDILCDEYSPDTIDLRNDMNNLTNFLLTTKERPNFHGILNDDFNRVYRTYLYDENITLYFFNSSNSSTTWEIVDYELQDYTGQFYNSYFKIVRNINATLQTIYQDRWYNARIDDIALESNTEDAYVQYVLYNTAGDTRIIAWDLIDDGDRRYIVVREPQFTDKKNYLDGAAIGFTTSYAASSVGVSYNVTVGTMDELTFTVSNYSADTGYNEIYSTTIVGGTGGSLTYIVDDNNATYWLTASMECSEYGTVKIASLKSPAVTEERFPFYDSFGIPATVMGLTREEIYTGAALFLITGVATMFGAVEVGTGAMVLAAVIGVMKFFQWYRDMTWGVWAFLAVMAVAFYIVSHRRKIE